jgi:hypothetical protein
MINDMEDVNKEMINVSVDRNENPLLASYLDILLGMEDDFKKHTTVKSSAKRVRLMLMREMTPKIKEDKVAMLEINR